MIHQSQVLLARRQVGHLAQLVGGTDDGETYAPTWFTTGSVVAERAGHAGALGLCDGLDLLIAHMLGKSWGIRRLAAFLPNQVGKSFHGEILFPGAVFGRLPRARIVATGFGDDYMTRTAPGVKWIMGTEGYRATFPDVRLGGMRNVDANDNGHRVDVLRREVVNGRDTWEKSGGYLVCRSFGGAVNGVPMDLGIMGDFYKNWRSALSPAENQDRRDFYTGVFSRRQQSQRTAMLLIFTPYTSTDLAHYVLDQWELDAEPYLVLRYPTLARPDRQGEVKRWERSPAQREGLRRFVAAYTTGEGPSRVPVGAPQLVADPTGDAPTPAAALSPVIRPYDPRPEGAPLLPFKDRQLEFYLQRKRSAPARDWAALDELDPDASVTETYPRSAWRYFDPRQIQRFARYAIVCDPNKRETVAGAFASIGAWGLEARKPLPTIAGAPPPPPPVYPWDLYRLRESRHRYGYSDLRKALIDMLDLWPEAKDMILEHTANGEALAGDHDFLANLARRNVTLWLAEPGGGFSRMRKEGTRWTTTKTGDPAALAGSKDERWTRVEVPLKEGHIHLPACDHGRVTADWVGDRVDGIDDATRQGWVTEWARAHPDGVVDRVDEGAMLVAWALSAPTLSDWSRFKG